MIRTTTKAVTLFKSTDDGAPRLTASAGSLKTLLKTCLLSGYGDKQPLGWEMPFEDGHIAVFRSKSPESNRHFLRVDNANTKFANLSGYLNMTAASVGSGQFSYTGNLERFGYCQYDRNDSNHWWLVGHDKCFALFVSHSNLNAAAFFMFGDVPSIVPNDTGNTILYTNSTRNAYFAHRDLEYIGSWGVLFAKTWSGAEQSAKAAFVSLAHNDAAYASYPDKISGGLMVSEMWLYERGGDNGYNLRGLLPALYRCQNNLRDLKDGTVIKMDGSDDDFLKFNLYDAQDKNYYLLNVSHWES